MMCVAKCICFLCFTQSGEIPPNSDVGLKLIALCKYVRLIYYNLTVLLTSDAIAILEVNNVATLYLFLVSF